MRKIATVSACVAVALLLAAPASAKVSVSASVLWSPNPDSDVEVYLHASNVAYPAPRDEALLAARLIPDATLVELPGSNHALLEGTPEFDQFFEEVSAFLAKHGG